MIPSDGKVWRAGPAGHIGIPLRIKRQRPTTLALIPPEEGRIEQSSPIRLELDQHHVRFSAKFPAVGSRCGRKIERGGRSRQVDLPCGVDRNGTAGEGLLGGNGLLPASSQKGGIEKVCAPGPNPSDKEVGSPTEHRLNRTCSHGKPSRTGKIRGQHGICCALLLHRKDDRSDGRSGDIGVAGRIDRDRAPLIEISPTKVGRIDQSTPLRIELGDERIAEPAPVLGLNRPRGSRKSCPRQSSDKGGTKSIRSDARRLGPFQASQKGGVLELDSPIVELQDKGPLRRALWADLKGTRGCREPFVAGISSNISGAKHVDRQADSATSLTPQIGRVGEGGPGRVEFDDEGCPALAHRWA